VGSNFTAALRKTALFGDLHSDDLEQLASRAVERKLRRGEVLFVGGESAAGLYVVVEGSIRAFRTGADGREQTIHVERAGATLAEIPVFDGGPYPSTTAAEEDSVVLLLEKKHVFALCMDRPAIALAALRLLASRMRNCAALVESLSLRDVDRRLAQLLLEESSDYGRHQGDSVTFELALTHQQLAARIGSVREVVSRALGRLQASRLIVVNGRTVTIPSKESLRDYAVL
jgi:CRP-like cAMP-binding protein